MSQDYYLVCKEKKLWMPIFTMNMGGCGFTDKNYTFDFILACSGSEILLVDENNETDMPDREDETWTFINAWQPYIDKGETQ
jgi:hypothetical protein